MIYVEGVTVPWNGNIQLISTVANPFDHGIAVLQCFVFVFSTMDYNFLALRSFLVITGILTYP